MKQSLTIQKLTAFILLVVFSISIAPKAYFHDVVAHHKDVITCDHPEKSSSCVHTKSFNCHFDDLVVTLPFLFEKEQSLIVLVLLQERQQSLFISSSTNSVFSEMFGRGPPACS